MDSILSEIDPGFTEALKAVSENADLASTNVDLDKFLELTGLEATGWKKYFFILPGGIWTYVFIKTLPRRLKALWNLFLDSAWRFGKYLFTQGPKDLIGLIKKVFSFTFAAIGNGLKFFKGLSWYRKAAFFVAILMVVALVATFKYSSQLDFLSPAKDPFMGSFEEVATKKFSYDPAQKAESFYNSLRFSGNIFRVRQMVINLKRTPENDRPMALFQVIVEGNSQDVIVEMKDRQSEMSDTIQRAAEDFTFGELQSQEGKKALLLKIKEAVNTRLTTGQVRRAYFQSIVLKP